MRYLLTNETTKEKVLKGNYYKEPVDKIIEDIKTSSSRKIIITGTKDSGKSTVLYSLEQEGITTENPSIITSFDNAGLTIGECDKEKLYTHMYELEMAENILNYIKTYYRQIYYDHFIDLHRNIKKLLTELDIYIRNMGYKDIKIQKMYKQGELTEKIIQTLKKSLESLTLIIDKFDSIDNSSELSQRKLSEYFELFDKIILASDDKTITSRQRTTQLNEKGYEIITIDYGVDIKNIKRIITPIINKYNLTLKKDDIIFPIKKLTDDLLTEVLKLTNGNIAMVLQALNNTHVLASWKDTNFNFEETLIRETNRQIEYRMKIERNYPKKILHL